MNDASSKPANSENPIYQPLGPRQTRRVWIRQQDGVLYFELEVVSIDSVSESEDFEKNQTYVALSYTWGPRDTVGVTVKGFDNRLYPVYVTKSLLVTCEYYLRTTQQFLPIWVDQLSIDQSNQDEKISQIHLMRDIYEFSYYVIIWLGPPDAESGVAMTRIRQIREDFRTLARSGEDWETDNGLIRPEFMPRLTGPNTAENMSQWRAMLKLLDRPWFSRVWVIQEGTSKRIFSDRTLVLCGAQKIFFDDFVRLYRLIANAVPWYLNDDFERSAMKMGFQNHSTFNLMVEFWMHRQMYSHFPLLSLLQWSREYNATDLRDKIVAVASFATDTNSVEFPLDISYNHSVKQTFTDFVIWHIRNYRNLDFLGFLQNETYNNNLVNVADWIPDWTMHINRSPYAYYDSDLDQHRVPLYLACGSDRMDNLVISGNIGNSASLQALTVSGIRVSTIKPWYPRIEDCEKFGTRMMHNQCPLNQIPLMHVFSRTLCADMTRSIRDRRPISARGAYYRPYQKCEKGHNDCFLSFPGVPGLSQTLVSEARARDFFMLMPNESEDVGVMGLGEKGLQQNDEVWMLDSGKTLYILRPWSLPADVQIRDLDVTGSPNIPEGRPFSKGSVMYQLIGECFVLGLMDGEIPEMLSDPSKRPKPPCMTDMDREFRKINIYSPRDLARSQAQHDTVSDHLETWHLDDTRLGLAGKFEDIKDTFKDKKRYWTPEIVERWDEEEKVPYSKPFEAIPPFLTCEVD